VKVEQTHAKTVSDLLFRVEVIQEEKAHLAHRSRGRERKREKERREGTLGPQVHKERERERREGTLGLHVHI
jgi:hypothetical protein